MKKLNLIILIFFTTCIFSSGFSQGLSVKLGGGYAIGMNQQSLPFVEYDTQDENGISTHRFWYSLGKGMTPELEIAYKFNKNFGIAINASYLYGTKNTAFNDYLDDENDYSYHYYSEMILISPSVLFEPIHGDFSPYAKLGGVFGSGKFYQKYDDMKDSENIYLIEYTGSSALGVNTALGMNYKLSSLISVYAEINAMIMSWAPEKAKVTKYIVEGEDQLPDMPVAEREIEFVESVEQSPYNPDEPSQALKQNFNFDNIGLRAGVKFSF